MAESPILLVDDDPDNATLSLFALKEAGIPNHVVVAGDGLEALELLFALSAPLTPALILLDIAMPRMDGWETLRRLRRDPRTTKVPVVIVSSSCLADARERAAKLGVDIILHKSLPFDHFAKELGAIVSSFLRGNKHAPTAR